MQAVIRPGDSVADLTAIGTGLVRLGAARGVASATSITLDANLDLGQGNKGVARALDLSANGAITEGTNALLNVTTQNRG